MKLVAHAAAFSAVSLIALGVAFTNVSADSGRNPLPEHVRAANDRFKDLSAAVAEGYAPIPCASGVDGGAMGIHYVNAQYLKDEMPDIKRP